MNDADALRTLAAEIDRDTGAVSRLCDDAREVLERFAAEQPGRLEVRIPGGLIHDYYTGVETALERVVEVINGSYPTGADSHQRLLSVMALDVEGLRPAVISEQSRAELDELRKFRHFFRHAYMAQIDWDLLRTHLKRIARHHETLMGELRSFVDFIRGLADSLASPNLP